MLDINKRGAFHAAATRGNLQVVQLLLEATPPTALLRLLLQQDVWGFTAEALARLHGHRPMVRSVVSLCSFPCLPCCSFFGLCLFCCSCDAFFLCLLMLLLSPPPLLSFSCFFVHCFCTAVAAAALAAEVVQRSHGVSSGPGGCCYCSNLLPRGGPRPIGQRRLRYYR